jgi:hypothetical protein
MSESRSLRAAAEDVFEIVLGTPTCPCGRALPLHMTPAVTLGGDQICTTCEEEALDAREGRYGTCDLCDGRFPVTHLATQVVGGAEGSCCRRCRGIEED